MQLEAGSQMFALLLQDGLCDELLLYMAPCLLGDQAQPLVKLGMPDEISQAHQLTLEDVCEFDGDLRLRYLVK